MATYGSVPAPKNDSFAQMRNMALQFTPAEIDTLAVLRWSLTDMHFDSP